MSIARSAQKVPGFQAGDPIVVLYQGRHNGLHGHFVGMRPDINWCDIKETQSGHIVSHPILWVRRREDVQGHTPNPPGVDG